MLNITEKTIVNETMKEWRKFTKPLHGLLTENPLDRYGSPYTFEYYAIEILEGIINVNNYKDILYQGEFENIKEEVVKRVQKAVEKSNKVFKDMVDGVIDGMSYR